MGTHDQLQEEVRDDDPTIDTPAMRPETDDVPHGEDDNPDHAPPPDDVAAINELLLSKTEELYALNDKYLRMAAEFENYKRRAQRDHRQAVQFANESLLRDILPTLDNLERAIQSWQPGQDGGNIEGLLEGVNLTYKHFLDTLNKRGMTQFSCKGETFDPTRHQAVGQVETADAPEHTVVDEHQKGYVLHDRIVRPAMVTVAQPPKEGAES